MNEGRLLKDVSQVWLVLYKVPFSDEYVLEVGQRRVVLRYKGHEKVVFSYVHFCVSVLVISFCLRKRPLRDVFLQL